MLTVTELDSNGICVWTYKVQNLSFSEYTGLLPLRTCTDGQQYWQYISFFSHFLKTSTFAFTIHFLSA